MPIPKPRKNETKDDFMDRCMGDTVTNKEFPDEKQRFGVCQTQWKEKKSMKPEKEIRHINTSAKVELRDDGSPGSIYGYPIVYNRDSEDMGFVEQIAPGAVTKALKRSDIRGLKNHDPSLIFARQGVNLTFTEDENGLKYEATPIDTRNYREIAEEVRTGLLTGQSFGFTVLKDEWSGLDTDHPKRTITEIGELFDVGPVTYPAYQDTTVALRSLDAAKEKPPATPEQSDQIEIILKRDGLDDLSYSFENKETFDHFMVEARKLSDIKPTLPGSDVNNGQKTDETLEKINKTIARLKNEDD